MAGFSGFDNMINAMSVDGNAHRADWNKTSASAGTVVANTFSCWAQGAGTPPANTSFGAGVTSVWKPCYDFSATDGGLQHGGNVAADYTGFKTLIAGSAYSAAATTQPCKVIWVDLLAKCTLTNATISTTGTKTTQQFENVTFSNGAPGLLMTTTNDWDTYTPCRFTTAGVLPTGLAINTTYWTIRQGATTSKLATSLSNAIAGTAIAYTDAGTPTNTFNFWLPRYGTGAGVDATLVVSTAGTAGTTTFQLTYTNSAGTGSRLTPSSPALPLNNATSPLFQIPFSGTGSGKFGHMFPKQGADAGIRSIQNIILASTGVTTGVYNLIMYKVLESYPTTTIGVVGEREHVSQIPSYPRVYDGACIVPLIYNAVAIPNGSNFYGHLQFGWTT
jgi:hypothetical protein